MSSEESLHSIDTDCKNKTSKSRHKQRKPDMQVYVPRAKRFEDQVKQRMSSEFSPSGCDEPNIGGGGGKTRFSLSSSPEDRSAKLEIQREFRASLDEKELPPARIKSVKSYEIDRTTTKAPGAITSGKKGPPPQPQTNKLPSQVIQEMMKRHNINVPEIPMGSPVDTKETGELDSPIHHSEERDGRSDESELLSPKAEVDSSILSCLPGSYQDFVKEDIAMSVAAASVRFASAQPALVSEYGQSLSSMSTSPVSSDAPDTLQVPVYVAGRGSPGLDAEDLEVKMINESFEETQRQMQLLASEGVKKAWSTAANVTSNTVPENATNLRTSAIPTACNTRSIAASSTIPTGSSTESTVDPVAMVVTSVSTKPVATISVAKSMSVGGGGSGKLTWAGWGTKKNESTDDASPGSTNLIPQKRGSDLSAGTVSSSSIGSATIEPQVPSTPSLPSQVSSIQQPFSTFHAQQRPSLEETCPSEQTALAKSDVSDTKEMDILSAAMIEKVLSEDSDDIELRSLHSQSSVTMVDPVTSSFSPANADGKKALADIWNRDLGTEQSAVVEASPAAESWEDLLDEPGDKLIAQLLQQKKGASEEKKTERGEIDYFKLPTRRVEVQDDEFAHIVEAYGFPPSFKADELYLTLQQLHCRDFRIEWVDDTHALIIFANLAAARNACDSGHPVIQLRPMSQASTASKLKAKSCKDTLQPFLRRPDTSAMLARRLVEGHLGKRSELTADQRQREREHIKHARDEKKIAAQQREDAWEGRL